MNNRLPRNALHPGMVLAEALARGDGALLLPAGTVLTARHIELFPFWHITEAVIAQDDGPDGAARPEPAREPEPDPSGLEEAARIVRPRFAHADPDAEPDATVFRLVLPHAARMLARKGPAALDMPPPVPESELPPLPEEPAPGPMSLIEAEPKLTSLPDVFVRINEALNNPRSTAKEAAEAIGMDTGLSAKLLKLVNSAFYGFPVKVDTLSRAVTIVGSRQLTTLALGLSVLALFKDLPEGFVGMRRFWKHSVGCGILASTLAAPGGDDGVERLFVAGLLHDVGRLVLYRSLPRHAAHTLALARREGILLRDAERRILGFDHATLGGMLLKRWRFPENLEKAVRHHHGGANCMALPMPAMVHVADAVTNALGFGSSGEVFAPPLSPRAFTFLELTPDRLAKAMASTEAQVEDIVKTFLPDEA